MHRSLFLGRFARDIQGIAASEFALTFPILLAAWLGMGQLGQLEQAAARTTMAAQSLSDLVADNYLASAPQLTDLVNAATQMLAPLPAGNALTVDVVSVLFDSQSAPTQAWRCTSGSNADVIVPLNLANGLGTFGQTVIMVTVTYSYTPTITGGILGGQTFVERSFNCPREPVTVNKPC
jgi:Flp pilus assembly protein TadG